MSVLCGSAHLGMCRDREVTLEGGPQSDDGHAADASVLRASLNRLQVERPEQPAEGVRGEPVAGPTPLRPGTLGQVAEAADGLFGSNAILGRQLTRVDQLSQVGEDQLAGVLRLVFSAVAR